MYGNSGEKFFIFLTFISALYNFYCGFKLYKEYYKKNNKTKYIKYSLIETIVVIFGQIVFLELMIENVNGDAFVIISVAYVLFIAVQVFAERKIRSL